MTPARLIPKPPRTTLEERHDPPPARPTATPASYATTGVERPGVAASLVWPGPKAQPGWSGGAGELERPELERRRRLLDKLRREPGATSEAQIRAEVLAIDEKIDNAVRRDILRTATTPRRADGVII